MADTPTTAELPDYFVRRLREGVASALAVTITLFTLTGRNRGSIGAQQGLAAGA